MVALVVAVAALVGGGERSILSGFVPEVAAISLCLRAAFQKMCYHLCLDCLRASGEINTHTALPR